MKFSQSLTLVLFFFISTNILAQSKLECATKEEANQISDLDPTIFRTCSYKGVVIKSTGSPDYKGRYYWESELFLKENERLINTSLDTIFGQASDKVTDYLNYKLKKDYEENIKLEGPCVRSADLDKYNLSEFRIDFNPREIVFWVDYGGKGSACHSVSMGMASMSYTQFDEFRTK